MHFWGDVRQGIFRYLDFKLVSKALGRDFLGECCVPAILMETRVSLLGWLACGVIPQSGGVTAAKLCSGPLGEGQGGEVAGLSPLSSSPLRTPLEKENKGRKQDQVLLPVPENHGALHTASLRTAMVLQHRPCRWGLAAGRAGSRPCLYPPNSPGMAAGSWAPAIELGTVVTMHSVTTSTVLGSMENSHDVKLQRF